MVVNFYQFFDKHWLFYSVVLLLAFVAFLKMAANAAIGVLHGWPKGDDGWPHLQSLALAL